ncbi:unnamed protein product [Rodentolepis nana]|uniref:NUC194 domain-containing protein n=1 Tax=Rodentolepis nana TaxID=102285 RepID=A0A0R3TRZ2_RODNA|nr:unnamed protein product [Rodentolepis nana]
MGIETSYSGFVCSKSAKLKEAWLRLFKKIITNSSNDRLKVTVPEIYAKQLFDQLATKHSQSVTSVLCSTLATIIGLTSTDDLRERFLNFLTKLLAEKLSSSTRRAEFVIISAVSSSIAKLLRSVEMESKYESNSNRFFEYALQILLAGLDNIGRYKPIKSACKLLSASCKYVSTCDWPKTQLVITYLQTLTNHKNSSLASTARVAYIDLLKLVSKSDSISDDEIKLVLSEVIPFLADKYVLETLPTRIHSFRLKCLSILLPLYVKHSSNHDSTQILALSVQEVTRMVDEISNNPLPPIAYSLVDLMSALLDLLTTLPEMLSSPMRESLLYSLKLGIVSCFQAYPRLSQTSTESIARAIVKIIEKMEDDKDALVVLDEAFYHIVLQTCSHSPFNLDVSESDDDDSNGAEKDTEDNSLEKIRQPNVSSLPEVAIPLPSFREYLPLWRYLLGLSFLGIRKEANHTLIPKHCSALVLRFLLDSSLVIVKRLDFSYDEVGSDTTDLETQVDVKTPHDVLILSNIAAFLEVQCMLKHIHTASFIIHRYPLLSGLYRLLKLSILLAKRSGFFQSNESAVETQLLPFAHFLIDSFPPAGALSADDLSIARSSCLLSFLPSVLFHSNITRIGHVITSISQLATIQGRGASLAIETVSAIEVWLKENKAYSDFYPTVFSALVPALVNLLNANPDERIATKSALPPIGRRFSRSYRRTELPRALKTLSKQPTASSSDSLIRTAQIKAIELIGQNVAHWNFLKTGETSIESDDRFNEILPTGKGVFNDLCLCLPFPDLRPSIRLSDLRLFTRILHILLWRPKSSNNANIEASKGFSRQTRVSAAEYIHEYIVFALNTQLAASNEPIESSDASYWQLLFQLVFVLGADDDPLIRRLFRSLAFQLVHWYAGYLTAGLCEAKLLLKTLLRLLKLVASEDDMFSIIESSWPIPESIDTLRTKLASVCLRDFLHWMNVETPGTKRRRSSLGDEGLDDLLRQILDGLCRQGSASIVFNDVVAPLLTERPELTRKYIYVLIDAFKRPGQCFSPAVLKMAFDLLISLIKNSPNDLTFEDYSPALKRPRLTRTSQNKSNVDSLKPQTWESASVSSCVKSFLRECKDSPNRKLFQELLEQILSDANLQLIPQILPDPESLISMLGGSIENPTSFIDFLDNCSWLISSNLLSASKFLETIDSANCSVIAKLEAYCSSPERCLLSDILLVEFRRTSRGSATVLKFLRSLLPSKPRIELSSIFAEGHSVWSFLVLCLLNPVKVGFKTDESIAIDMLKLFSKGDITFVKGSISQFLESEGSELTITPDVVSKLIHSVFSISTFFQYQVSFDKELIFKSINQLNKCEIHPVALLSILGLKQENDTPLESPNTVIATLLKLFAIYSRGSNKLRTSQLCEGVTKVWKKHIETLLRFKDFDSCLFVDLLEAIISLSPVELDRNIFISAFLLLLKDETLNVPTKVKNLDMLAFFLQSDITPTNFNLSNERRYEIVEAVKYLFASNLPLDQHEIASSPTKLAQCSTLLKSVLSLLKTLSCPEAILMLTMTSCRYDDHFMDEELEESLRIAMKRIWTRPLAQEQLLATAINYFDQACSESIPSPGFINLWHRYIHKFLKPLLLSVSPSALERLAARNINKWLQILEGNASEDGVHVTTQWFWRLLNRVVAFYLLVTIYNRLPKSALHGLTAGGVGSVLRAFLGPSELDLIQSGKVKGTELTAAIIKKVRSTLEDQLNPRLNPPLTDELETIAKTLKQTVWSASLSCLIAAVSATQSQEKAFNCILVRDSLTRFLPNRSFTFPRRRSGKYRSAFIELGERFWLPSEREPYFGKIDVQTQGMDSSLQQRNKSGGLLLGSSLSVEINRFMRASGTQIIRGSTSSTDFKKPLSPGVSPPLSQMSPSFRQLEEVEEETNYVNLEVDPLNMTSLMIAFIGLLKRMSQLGLLKSNEMPQVLKFLYDQFNSNQEDCNVRAFVVKLVINCPEARNCLISCVFKPFSKHWFPLLLIYASSNTEALLDSWGLSSLAIDLCLLLADWSRSSILPTIETEKMAAQGVLAFLVKYAWFRASDDGVPDIPEGVAPALKHNLELIQLLAESWLPAGVQIPYRQAICTVFRMEVDLLAELQQRADNKRVIFTLHLFKTILISCQRFAPEIDNLPLSQFVCALLMNIHQTSKTLLTAAWECSALLASKCFTPQSFITSSGEFLRSRGVDILPLSAFPKDLHPLINELWSMVTELNTVHRCKRPSDTPVMSVIEASCASASHWSVLALHLANSLLGTGIPKSIEPSSFVHCLRVFTKLLEDFNENKLEFSLDQAAKIEVLQNIVNSNAFEIIKLENAVVLFHGTMLILRMVQLLKNIPQNSRDLNIETRNSLVLRLMRFLLSSLARSNSTPNSRRIAYRIFIEVRKNEKSTGTREIMELCHLGLSYGLCAEDDNQLRRQLRKYVSEHYFDSSPVLGLSPSLARCLQTFQLLSASHRSYTDNPTLVSSIGRHLISTSLQIVLEPAIKSAEFRHPFRSGLLDPHYPFTDASFSRTSISISQSFLDPVVFSGTQQLRRSQTQLLETALVSTTLDLQGDDSTQTQLLTTQQIPSNSLSTQFGETLSDQSAPRQVFFPLKPYKKVKKVDFKNLSPVEQLRRKFAFATTLAAQNPDLVSRSENPIREIFKNLTIQRQHAEMASGNSSLSLTEYETTARLCRRHRIGALPDVAKLTPKALLQPLFQLAKLDSSICGPALLRIVLESIIVSSGKSANDDFVKELGASLARLLTRGGIDQSVACLSLIWELGMGLERERIILSMIPEPKLLSTCAISSEKALIGVSIMEEVFCNLAMRWCRANSLLFSDGIRRIDYIIAFKLHEPSIEAELRECFLNLSRHGVDIEIEDSSGEAPVNLSEEMSSHQFVNNKPIFAKLHVQWNKLLQVAELLHFQKPIVSLSFNSSVVRIVCKNTKSNFFFIAIFR